MRRIVQIDLSGLYRGDDRPGQCVYIDLEADGRRRCRTHGRNGPCMRRTSVHNGSRHLPKIRHPRGTFPTQRTGPRRDRLIWPGSCRQHPARFMRSNKQRARGALMACRSPVPPSPAFEATARGAQSRDRIAVVVKAPKLLGIASRAEGCAAAHSIDIAIPPLRKQDAASERRAS